MRKKLVIQKNKLLCVLLLLGLSVLNLAQSKQNSASANTTNISRADISFLTFNVQNLFDDINDNQEYQEYRPPQWKTKDYQQRLITIGKALQTITPLPDFIVLQEIENNNVLKDLQRYYLPSYRYAYISENTYTATEIAILSKYNFDKVLTHNTEIADFNRNRVIVEVILTHPHLKNKLKDKQKNSSIQLLLVHLKSKRDDGQDISSQQIQAVQFKHLAKLSDPSLPTFILGDFNNTAPLENNDLKDYHSATLISTNTRITGTYYYKKSWQQLDHILYDTLASTYFSDTQYVVWALPPFITKWDTPNKFIRARKNFTAVSDHLPVLFLANIK